MPNAKQSCLWNCFCTGYVLIVPRARSLVMAFQTSKREIALLGQIVCSLEGMPLASESSKLISIYSKLDISDFMLPKATFNLGICPCHCGYNYYER